ncbi:bifunctional (p)ppGpp synthetase/guanosine-3',5'-bis(diphosphate) 3'-pyrophosphohydrolase [Candidatus Kaiserbacteria bacterium]|nr:bifunctional (p)ppGpp synthetase/guanosine-3',5'-bis(diphosphate) 3'-pyrophosphohydrolase [Candidatus Kaiserbacteria bacterium]
MTDLESIFTNLSTAATKEDRDLITRAYECAKTAHKDHMRRSGEPYLTHLVAVAKTLAEIGMGPKTIAAGLLHDTIEDTDVTPEEIKEQFGDEVLFLVEGVTKLGSVRYHGVDRHNESLRKLFVATSQEIRVLMVKLADRLHNMQTLEYVPKEKQKRIAQETLEIYVPVAHRLGMGRFRKELEDLAFPYVYPEEYAHVKQVAGGHLKHALETLEKLRKTLQKKLAEAGIKDFKTSSRVKGMYSLFRKLEQRDWDIDKIYDLLAIRVVVPTVEDCYHIFGIVHELWRPLPHRVKDYIAFPEPNGYQSLHTTVIAQDRTILEVQIRTEDMHKNAEFGVASHLVYKQTQSGDKSALAQYRAWAGSLIPSLFYSSFWRWSRKPVSGSAEKNKESIPQWIQEIAAAHQESANTERFVTDLRQDFFSQRIFIFTPEGDVVDLPVGATPIDFAYAIHTDIGDHIAGAKVNNKLVHIDTALRNGDIVEIITRPSSRPTAKWLSFTKTALARRRIRIALGEIAEKKA